MDQHTKSVRLDGIGDAAPTSADRSSEVSATQTDGKQVVPVWCPVANMTSERPYGPSGEITKRGSKHFAAGAKLYFIRIVNYDKELQLEMVGRHRGSHRYVTMIVSLSWLENWRPELVYSPYVAKQLYPVWKSGALGYKFEAEFYVRKFVNREF